MQEAPNSYEKDEQQERGNYDSAVYMKRVSDILGEAWLKIMVRSHIASPVALLIMSTFNWLVHHSTESSVED